MLLSWTPEAALQGLPGQSQGDAGSWGVPAELSLMELGRRPDGRAWWAGIVTYKQVILGFIEGPS